MEERSDLNTPDKVLGHARALYASRDYRGLESLFSRSLRKSYCLELWMLYIEYVKKVSQKKFKLHEVYEFTLAQFEHHWDAYDLYREYIEELGKIEDEQMRIEKTRSAYMRALQNPMGSLSEVWKGFENFELELNKITGKKIVIDALPLFQSSFQRYQAILPLIRAWSIPNAARLVDAEMENGSKLGPRAHASRMQFIHNYIINCFHDAEEAYFFHSEYLVRMGLRDDARKTLQRGMETVQGLFLPLYYALTMDDEAIYTRQKSDVHSREPDLLGINHLNYTLKKKGLESFRKLFIELSKEAGPEVFVYCALVEYYATGSRATPHNIFSSGLLKHPDSTQLKEEFFLFLLRIGDEENARALFKRLDRTNRMWDAMIEYEFMVGSMDLFRELTEQKMAAVRSGAILPGLPEKSRRKPVDGILGKYHCFLNAFGLADAKMDSRPLDEFLERLPQISQKNNVLSNIDPDRIVDLLRTVK